MINIDAATSTALSLDGFEYAFMCELPGGLYYTNHGSDIIWNGITYVSNGLLVKFANVKQGQELSLATYTLGLSNVDNTIAKAYVSGSYRGQVGIVSMAIMLDGALQGSPLVVYRGTLDSYGIRESLAKSELSLKLTSHWASYNQKAGRYTSDTLQQDLHPGDRIFQYAHAEQSNIGWGRR